MGYQDLFLAPLPSKNSKGVIGESSNSDIHPRRLAKVRPCEWPHTPFLEESGILQEFITKAVEELQEARAMRGDRCPPPGAAPCPGEGSELRACVNIPGLNMAASQELFWPSCVGRCEGPPHGYVHMHFGLLNRVVILQCHMRGVLAAQEARHQAILAEMATIPREAPRPPETPAVQDPGGS